MIPQSLSASRAPDTEFMMVNLRSNNSAGMNS